MKWAPRQSRQWGEIGPEFRPARPKGRPIIVADRPPNVQHQALEVTQVMGRNQTPRHGFAGIQEMSYVGPAVAPRTGRTITARINRGIVLSKLCIFEIHASRTREGLGISSVSGRKDAVEHVDSTADRMQDVLFVSHPHQVARLLRWQAWCSERHDLGNLLRTFSNRNAPNREARQVVLADGLHRSGPEGAQGRTGASRLEVRRVLCRQRERRRLHRAAAGPAADEYTVKRNAFSAELVA